MKYRYLINELENNSFYLWDRLLKVGYIFTSLDAAVNACSNGDYIVNQLER